MNPDPVTQERFKEVTAAYEVLSDPEKRQMYDLGADPRSPGGGPFGPGTAGFGFGDIMDAFFGGHAGAWTKPRVRRGQDALIKVAIDLPEAAFGVVKEIQVDTARGVPDVHRRRAPLPGTQPTECSMCRGRGEIQSVQRSFLGQVMTSPACPQCQGYGTVITHPCSGVHRRRARAHPAHAHGQDPRRRRRRHPHPAVRRGRGRPRRRPRRGPVRRGVDPTARGLQAQRR